MEDTIYRKLTLSDIESYIRIRSEMLENNPTAFGMSYDDFNSFNIDKIKELFSAMEFVLGCFTSGELVACVGIVRRIGRKVEHTVTFVSIYCSDKYRNKGLSRKLLQEAVYILQHDGKTKQILLQVVTDNIGAVNLYESIGFIKYGVEPRTIQFKDKFYDEYLMCLKIND